jgi:hypothetical protein
VRPRRITFRRLHRWLGIGALVFLVFLSVTGIALNHTAGLHLDERHVAAPWLLSWYGIEAPQPAAAFATELGDVVLVGERLYLGEREIAAGLTTMIGAASWREYLVVAATDAVLFFAADGTLARQVEAPVGNALTAVGVVTRPAGAPTLVVASRTARFGYDADEWVAHGGDEPVRWSAPVPLDSEDGERIARAYRGPGISLARLLADLHSGRLFGRAGIFATDAIGVVLVLLGLTGLVLWLRSRR